MVTERMLKLRKWREAQDPKVSLATAGGKVGVSAVQWLRLETGARRVTPEMAVKIEALTGIPRAEFWDGFAPAKRKREPQTVVA